MAIPTVNEHLKHLKRMRADAIVFRDSAAKHGNSVQADEFAASILDIEAQIEQHGGTIDA